MNSNEYDDQRTQGAEQIAARARELANASGIELSECIWDGGQEIMDRDNHVLEIHTENQSARGQFLDEQLADYPGRVGTERTEAILRDMVRTLTER